MKLSRRHFLSGLSGLAIAGCGGPMYARWIEPRWLRITRVRVPFFPTQPSRSLRILHLSDLHLSRVVPLPFIDRAIRWGIAEQPDVAVITGDLITRRLDHHQAYVQALRRLSDVMPVFAVLGNHDGGLWAKSRRGYADTQSVRRLLSDSGIHLLHNTAAPVSLGDQTLWMVGVGDLWAGELDAHTAFREVPDTAGHFRVLLSHNPDSKSEMEGFPWELMLCGHTHGGQLALPLLGTPLAPVHDHRFVAGLNRWGHRWIHTTRGVGNLHGIRFNCRPEVSVLELAGPVTA